MNSVPAALLKNTLIFQSYKKAHSSINTFSENPVNVIDNLLTDIENEFLFIEYVPEVLSRLCQSTVLEWPNNEFSNLIDNIDHHIRQFMSLEIHGVFHFGLLFENIHLFTEQEQGLWKKQMSNMFEDFVEGSCYNMFDYYKSHSSTQFFNADNEFYKQFVGHMEYTFVFISDFDFHAIEDFGPSFMSRFHFFAEEYYKFYSKLILEIKKRRERCVTF